MKFLLRVVGTWFVGLSLILVIVDITRSFAAGGLQLTSLAQLWTQMHAPSWDSVLATLMEHVAPLVGEAVVLNVVGWPGWVFFLGFGSLFMLLGRRARKKQFVSPY